MAVGQGRQRCTLHIDHRGEITEMLDEHGLWSRLIQGEEARRPDSMDFTEDLQMRGMSGTEPHQWGSAMRRIPNGQFLGPYQLAYMQAGHQASREANRHKEIDGRPGNHVFGGLYCRLVSYAGFHQEHLLVG